jgi:hypothetical protein
MRRRKASLVLTLATLFLLTLLFVDGLPSAEAQTQPSTVASISPPPIAFSETLTTLRLNFTMFVVQFDKSSGSSTIYNRDGSVLVYYHFVTLQYFNTKVSDWRQAGSFQKLEWVKSSDTYYLVVEYFVDQSTSPQTNYTVTYSIKSDSPMKISVRVESGATRQYRLVWSLDGIAYSNWVEMKNSDGVKHRLRFGDESKPYGWMALDWQDVYEEFRSDISSYSVSTSARGRKADIYFDLGVVDAGGVLIVDPSVVGTSTIDYAIRNPFQRKSFYANGLFWVFYHDGTNMVYKTSTDGSTWSAAVTVRSCSLGSQFSIWFDGTYLHYVVASGGLKYRRGLPNSDGSITWSADEQSVSTVYNHPNYPTIATDSNGYVWIGYQDSYSSIYPYVIKSGNNDGTWGTTPSGFPYLLSTTDSDWYVSVIPLTAGKMAVVFSSSPDVVYVKAWTGSSWLSTVSISTQTYHYHSAAAVGDVVHIVFTKFPSPYDICYVKYSYSSNSFSAITTIQASGTNPPVIGVDASGDLYVFWAGYPTANHIYYRKYTASTNTWESVVDWVAETSLTNNLLTCFYQVYGSRIGVLYLVGSSSPYSVKFAYLQFNSPPNAPALNSPAAGFRFNPGASVQFTWTFSDPNPGDSQSAYQLQIGNSDFSTIYVDTGKVSSSSSSATVTLPSTVGLYYWRVKTWDSSDAEGVWSSGRAIIVDRIKVNSLSASKTRLDVGSSVTLTAQLVYEYDGSYIASGSFTLNGLTLSYTGSNGVWQTSDSKSSVQAVTYNSLSGSEGTYGLTAINMNGKSTTVVWDRVKVSSLTASKSRVDVGSPVTLSTQLVYEYDNTPVTSGSFTLNGTALTYSNGYWVATAIGTRVQAATFSSIVGSDGAYGLTTINMNGKSATVIWDGIKLAAYAVDVASEKVAVLAKYAYDSQPIVNCNVSYSGLYALTNSSGWAVFDLSKVDSVPHNSIAYPISEANYGLTAKLQNQTVAFSKFSISDIGIKARSRDPLTFQGWDSTNKQLKFAKAGNNEVKIYVGSLGKPYYILVDGVVKTEGQGWSFDSASNTLTILGSTNYIISWTPLTQEASSAGGGGGGGGASIISTPTSPQPQAQQIPPPQPQVPSEVYTAPPDLLTLGMVSLAAIISIVLIWQEIQKRLSPHSLWSQRLKKMNRKVKWRKRRYW